MYRKDSLLVRTLSWVVLIILLAVSLFPLYWLTVTA